MVAQIKCASCGKLFHPEASGEEPTTASSPCGNPNSAANPSGNAMNSPLQRKPPNAELCPSCQTRMAPECGCCSGRKWIAAAGAALLALAGSAAFLFGPEPEGPSPEAPVAAPEAAVPVPSSAPGVEMPTQPVPTPVSIPEEITDQKTELERVAQDSEQALRRQLDESEPLYKINEPV